MIIHKMYECEYCGAEFDDELDARVHEDICDCNPIHGFCGSCEFGERRFSYEESKILCKKLHNLCHTCTMWKEKKEEQD